MFGATAVKHIAMDAKSNPPKKASGTASKNNGELTNGNGVNKPATATTNKTIDAFMVARVAPHNNSPATTSSTLTGVATMASKVF